MNKLFFEYIDYTNTLPKLNKKIIRELLLKIAIDFNKTTARIHISIISEGELATMNEKFLNHHDFTDVITYDNSYDDILMGEIYISANRTLENAKNFQIEVKKELLRYIIHGVLHLCGYTDETDEKRVIMRTMEDKYLSKL